MKKWLALICAAALVLSFACVASAEDGFSVKEDEGTPSSAITSDGREELWMGAELLKNGQLIDAVNTLAGIRGDPEAAQYSAYAQATLSLARNDYATARERFAELGDFWDAAYQCRRIDALSLHRYYDGACFGYVDADGAVRVTACYDWAERVFREDSCVPYDEHNETQSLLAVAAVFEGETVATRYGIDPGKGKYGLVRNDGALIVPVEWDEVLWTCNGVAALRVVEDEQPRCALFDLLTGAQIGEAYEQIGAYSEGLIAVRKDKTWGYTDASGTMLPGGFCWDKALDFSEGMAGVTSKKLAGFIDRNGEIVIPLQYQDVASFGEGYAGFRQNRRWGFLNMWGNVVIKPKYDGVAKFDAGCCAVQSGKRWGLIDREGNVILKIRYAEITAFDPIYRRAWIRTNKLWGLVTPAGNVTLTPAWSTFTPFGADGLSCVSYRGSYGYINTQGTAFIPSVYAYATRYSANLGGMVDEHGVVRYQNRFGRGFTLPVNVPTEALHGFIEGVSVMETVEEIANDRGKIKKVTQYEMRYDLFDVSGRHIAIGQ